MTLFAIGLLFGLGSVYVRAQSALYAQCGGTGWSGATTCVSGAACTALNDFYSQCLPSTGATTATPSTTTRASITTTMGSSTISVPSAPSATCTGLTRRATGKLSHTGVNIAGFDFGCNSDGNCNSSGAWPPLLKYYGHDGEGQMQHFVNDDGFNTFRLPVGWQFLTNDVLTGTLNQTNLAKYDDLVQACLNTGAYCIIDVHNYARFNGKIIGQGGPDNEVFATLWSNIAAKYASTSKVMFGIMNEPHDVPDIVAWAASVQAAVTAIRNAGASTQIILLPGNNWTSAATFVPNGSADALHAVINPDGSKTNLVFDVHKYLDSDNSGTNSECVTNNIQEAWAPLADWLRCHGRQAFNTETGGGNTASCVKYLCEQVAFQAQNSDVFLGYVGWSAGNFDSNGYVLSEVPTQSGTTWVDTSLVKSCLAPISGSQDSSTS